MSRRYLVERTDKTGHWRFIREMSSRRRAIAWARDLAVHGQGRRRRVTVMVRAPHESPERIAGWVNGRSAWGDAFQKRRT